MCADVCHTCVRTAPNISSDSGLYVRDVGQHNCMHMSENRERISRPTPPHFLSFCACPNYQPTHTHTRAYTCGQLLFSANRADDIDKPAGYIYSIAAITIAGAGASRTHDGPESTWPGAHSRPSYVHVYMYAATMQTRVRKKYERTHMYIGFALVLQCIYVSAHRA